ncbi:MAG: hypothetical protein MUF34_09220 [Polyangiaceae bacterium]|nr:hypothetical protein [Polyangiaceae bacterium]
MPNWWKKPSSLWLALAIGALLTPWGVKRAHRLVEPPPLSADEMRAALAAARATFEAGAAGRKAGPLEGALDRAVNAPVFVSVYVPGRVGDNLFVGRWQPDAGGGQAPLRQALEAAGSQAGAAIAKARPAADRLAKARVKIDLVGPSSGIWTRAAWYLDWLFDPGRDGLVARRGDGEAWFLPSWTVERGEAPPRAIERLDAELGGRADSIARFRSFAFVEGVEGEAGPLPLHRGNVLRAELDPAMLQQTLREAGAFLTRSVSADGRYCYTYDAGTDACDNDYNLLRHAGTTYSLFQLYRELRDPSFLAAAERATGWLRRQVRPVEGDPTRAFLLEGDKAKLGAVGLSLLALVERERAVHDGVDRALLAQLADFVRSQQRDDGYFTSYFNWGPDANVPRDNSIYYPGEALLGLVRLYGIDPQARYLASAVRGAEFLVKRRWRWGGIELYVPPDAWLTQALAELDAIAPADWVRDYTYEIVQTTELTMLRQDEGAPVDLAGGPAAGPVLPNVTPAGSRNEGLTAAYRMAVRTGDRAKAESIRALSIDSARFQIGQQFRPANSYFLPNPERARGGFRSTPHRLDVRIDYVQHNATGLLGLLGILREARP